ncbi:glutathione transferase [Salvia divinorum]|uniref:glutathione transferase n=1 Tax=Salvia divinorum TaxID=28513 RepID=A0ABD1I332_SALDI
MEKSDGRVEVVGYWISAYVHRVRWALKLKGVDYKYTEEDIFNKTPLLSHLNPVHGKVPVLIHHGNPLPESAVIIEYIDDVWTHDPLLPQDPILRAQARFWAKFLDQKVITSTALALYSEGEDQERAVKLAVEYLDRIEEQLQLQGNIFFGGEKIGYVDLVMGFVAYILPVWQEVASVNILDLSRFPAIAAWTVNFLEHPVIKTEYLPHRDEIFSFYSRRRQELLPLCGSQTHLGKKVWSFLLS